MLDMKSYINKVIMEGQFCAPQQWLEFIIKFVEITFKPYYFVKIVWQHQQQKEHLAKPIFLFYFCNRGKFALLY